MTKMHSFPRTFVVAQCALMLVACTSTAFEGKYTRSEGWRRGQVIRLTRGDLLERPQYWACTRDLDARERAVRRYAVVRYVSGHNVDLHAAEVKPGDEFGVEARVYVNVNRCQSALIAHRRN